jgi:hypothetical protein
VILRFTCVHSCRKTMADGNDERLKASILAMEVMQKVTNQGIDRNIFMAILATMLGVASPSPLPPGFASPPPLENGNMFGQVRRGGATGEMLTSLKREMSRAGTAPLPNHAQSDRPARPPSSSPSVGASGGKRRTCAFCLFGLCKKENCGGNAQGTMSISFTVLSETFDSGKSQVDMKKFKDMAISKGFTGKPFFTHVQFKDILTDLGIARQSLPYFWIAAAKMISESKDASVKELKKFAKAKKENRSAFKVPDGQESIAPQEVEQLTDAELKALLESSP